MNIIEIIQEGVVRGVRELYGETISPDLVTPGNTRKEFEGDYTVVVFPLTRIAKKKPEAIAQDLGEFLVREVPRVDRYNVIKGFLNLVVSDDFWRDFLGEVYQVEHYGRRPATGKKVMVEFASPNTNKPLHLGHIRNILLGWSISQIMEAAGNEVVKVQVVNDRGIAICKSMLAWQLFGDGATPESTGIKGDHLVGEYYVLFEKKFREEYLDWQQTPEGQAQFLQWKQNEKAVAKALKNLEEARRKAKEKADREGETFDAGKYTLEKYFFGEIYKNTYFNEYSDLGRAAKDMLLRWEQGDPDTIALWKKMNGWVYQGFEETYRRLGVSFDKLYFESDTYLLGRDSVEKGLQKSIFFQKYDGSVWIDLSDAKLDEKVVLRSDGTSVYVTQDIGTAQLRYEDYGIDKMIYVVADEQNYHFQVLFEILKRLEEPYADGLHHLAYGMVDLTTGKMKSREGTVVDADDLIDGVMQEARANTAERGTIDESTPSEQEEIIRRIALAALKFFIIKVSPKKRMTFDPKESIDLQGQTGPYVQNAYVRIQSVLRKAGKTDLTPARDYAALNEQERSLISQLYAFPEIIAAAAADYDPSTVANYCYDLAKAYHKFYHDFSILRAESEAAKAFRLRLCHGISNVLRTGMGLLGIDMPDRM